MFFDLETTALEFGREYLGMPDPVVVGEPTATGDGTASGRIRDAFGRSARPCP